MSRIVIILFVTYAILACSNAKPPKCLLKCDLLPNEEYRCGSACQTTCRYLNVPCPIINIRCNDACYCINGYARNDSGICIPISDCSQ